MKNSTRLFAFSLFFAPAFGFGQTQAPAEAMALTDNQIAEIIQTANNAEIDAAKMAQGKASHADVKGFAKHMIEGHTQNLKDLKKVEHSEKLKPEASPVAQQLHTDAQNKMTELRKAKGAEFEKAYMASQVAMHTQLLTDLDQKFIPAAKDPEFKTFLQTTREHVQQHLSKAQEIQTTIAK